MFFRCANAHTLVFMLTLCECLWKVLALRTLPIINECASILQINRNTVTTYLNSGKLFNNKWIFSSTILSKEELSKWVTPLKIWEILTGELLGDGYISYNPIKNPLVNGRIEFTFSAKILHYVNHLKYHALASICTNTVLILY